MHVLSIERKANQALPELASNDVSASANCNCSRTAQCEVWGLDNANVNLQHQQKRPYSAHLRIHIAHTESVNTKTTPFGQKYISSKHSE